MPAPAISLIGFMEQQHAINYMRLNCIMPDPSDVALTTEWAAAKAKLGPPHVGAGHPDIQPIPPGDQQYIQQLLEQPWVQQGLMPYPGATFQAIEIDPLLAFQFHILTDHSDEHCSGLNLGPGIADLLPVCLPQGDSTGEHTRVWATTVHAYCRGFLEHSDIGSRMVSNRKQGRHLFWYTVAFRACRAI